MGFALLEQHLGAVDVINFFDAALCQILIEEFLQCANRQIIFGFANFNQPDPIFSDHADLVPGFASFVHNTHHGFQRINFLDGQSVSPIGFHRLKEVLLDVEDQAVDGFKRQCRVVDVLDFHQCVTGRVIHPHLWFDFFPDSFCGCQRVIAVTHRK